MLAATVVIVACLLSPRAHTWFIIIIFFLSCFFFFFTYGADRLRKLSTIGELRKFLRSAEEANVIKRRGRNKELCSPLGLNFYDFGGIV